MRGRTHRAADVHASVNKVHINRVFAIGVFLARRSIAARGNKVRSQWNLLGAHAGGSRAETPVGLVLWAVEGSIECKILNQNKISIILSRHIDCIKEDGSKGDMGAKGI
jgi:hypothetical protein